MHNESVPRGFLVRVELLPSSVPSGSGAAAPQFLSSYLIGDHLVIDGGSVGLLADVDRQRAVRHVFLTHAHLDHVASLPLLIENVYEHGPECVEVLASPATLAQIQADLFNGRTWPDFLALSTPDDAFMKATPIAPFHVTERAGCRITPVPVTHSGDTLGMIVDDGRSCVAFTADTGPTALIWQELATRPTLTAVFLECSFPNSMERLATDIGHLCPNTFAAQRAHVPDHVRVFFVHRKARYADQIARELAALALPNVEPVIPGHTYDL